MSIFDIKPIKYNDGTILYKGKKYTNENDRNLINQLNIDKQNKTNAQRKRLEAQVQPNSILAPELRATRNAELANLNALQTARQFEGRNPAARTVEDIVLNRMPPKIDNTPAGLLGITTPNVDIDVNSLLTAQSQPVQSQQAQPQPKKTLGQRASGLLDNVSNAYMNAAPMFAVANEFTKAGALRPIGGQIQGDPYGTMMQLQQNEQQLESLEKLRQDPQYAQFANLPNDLFIDAVKKQNDFVIENQLTSSNTYANIDTNVSSENLMTQLNETKKPIVLSEYEERAHGNSEMAHGIENTAALIAGSISVPFTSRNLAKRTEEARAATVDYFNEVRGILVDNVGGRVTVFDKKAVNNQFPAEFKADGSISSYSSEGEALAKYQGLKGALTGQLKDAIALTQDPNTRDDKTVMRKANSKIDKLRRAIRMTDIRIDSLNQERRGDDAFYGERDDLFENPIDTSGRIGMTEEQAEEIFFSDLDTTFE